MEDGHIQYNDKEERRWFGGAIILGFLGLTATGAFLTDADGKQIIRDGLLVLGPPIGIIVQAIWKTSSVERQQAATNQTLANAVATPMTTTVTTETSHGSTDRDQTTQGSDGLAGEPIRPDTDTSADARFPAGPPSDRLG